MAGIFGEYFLVSVSHDMKHENCSQNSGKIRSKMRGRIRDENSKIQVSFVLQLTSHVLHQDVPLGWNQARFVCIIWKFLGGLCKTRESLD